MNHNLAQYTASELTGIIVTVGAVIGALIVKMTAMIIAIRRKLDLVEKQGNSREAALIAKIVGLEDHVKNLLASAAAQSTAVASAAGPASATVADPQDKPIPKTPNITTNLPP